MKEAARSLFSSLAAAWRSDTAHGLRHSPVAAIAGVTVLILLIAALAAPFVAPYDTFDPASAAIIDARLPPGSRGLVGDHYLLGTDPLGRDLLSAMLYGLRLSLAVGFGAILLAAFVGVIAGLLSGYCGGLVDAALMRIADIQLSLPPILIALMIDGIALTAFDRDQHRALAIPILIVAISTSLWVQFARIVRAVVRVERDKDYILSARISGVGSLRVLTGHVLPNCMGPVLVIATVNLAVAILTESTLSFLGVGVPPTEPSLGTLVRIGNEFLFSGDWWISLLPGVLLVVLSLSVNIFGDWLRDVLNPKARGA